MQVRILPGTHKLKKCLMEEEMVCRCGKEMKLEEGTKTLKSFTMICECGAKITCSVPEKEENPEWISV